jgi:hypothetical protein
MRSTSMASEACSVKFCPVLRPSFDTIPGHVVSLDRYPISVGETLTPKTESCGMAEAVSGCISGRPFRTGADRESVSSITMMSVGTGDLVYHIQSGQQRFGALSSLP